MHSDFDFGNFLDLSSQTLLKGNCLKLFESLCSKNMSDDDISVIRQAILDDPISKDFPGFNDTIRNLEIENRKSISRVFPHLNLMINALNDNDELIVEICRIKDRLGEKLPSLYGNILNKDDIWTISQIQEFIEPGNALASILTRFLDLEISKLEVINKIKEILPREKPEEDLKVLLKKLMENDDRGFITGEKRQLLLERGVDGKLVDLVTKESLKGLPWNDLNQNKLFLIAFNERILEDKPDFVERIIENGTILTSTGAGAKEDFLFLVLSKNDVADSFFRNYNKVITEVCK